MNREKPENITWKYMNLNYLKLHILVKESTKKGHLSKYNINILIYLNIRVQ